MKSPFALAAVLSAATLLAACGQTGPLYLPKPPKKPSTQENIGKPGVPPPSAPVPSTPPASQQ